jgi:hypothetical protein
MIDQRVNNYHGHLYSKKVIQHILALQLLKTSDMATMKTLTWFLDNVKLSAFVINIIVWASQNWKRMQFMSFFPIVVTFINRNH